MPNLRGSELLIILLIVVLLFGAKRLPDAARGIGRSLRIFKAETKGLVQGETEADSPAEPKAELGSASPAPAGHAGVADPAVTDLGVTEPVATDHGVPDAQPQSPRQA